MHRFLLGLAAFGQLVLIQGPNANGTSGEEGIEFDFSAGILATQEDESSVETPASAELSASIDAGQSAASTTAEDLAKKTQNPVADLISLPFQNNFTGPTGPTGPGDDVLWVLNVQPVIPVKLTREWNLITRTVLPLIHQPSLADGLSSDNGLGDLQ